MKRLLAMMMLLFCVPAFALSDSEYRKLMKNSDFAKADRELTRAYNQAKEELSPKDFASLKESQREWIRSGRDEEAQALIDEGLSRTKAYTRATQNRTEAIWDYRAEAIINAPTFDGYYENGDISLSIVSRGSTLFVSIESGGDEWNGECEHADFRKNAGITAKDGKSSAAITVIDNDTLRVKTNRAFMNVMGFDGSGTFTRNND